MPKAKFAVFRSHLSTKVHPKPRCEIPDSTVFLPFATQSAAEERAKETLRSNSLEKRSMPDPNLPLLEDAVRKLAPFVDEIVFVGGVTLGRLITDEAAAPVRGNDRCRCDCRNLYLRRLHGISERLRQAHFTEDTGEKPLTCRWHHGALTLDVLPLSKEVLGFTNRWYAPALEHASTFTMPSGRSIRLITAPFFLGTKMEAVRGRGNMDYQASHDLEDFVAVIEGRKTVLKEIAASPRVLGIISLMLQKPCLRNRDFSMCFLVLSWTTSGSRSSKNGWRKLPRAFLATENEATS